MQYIDNFYEVTSNEPFTLTYANATCQSTFDFILEFSLDKQNWTQYNKEGDYEAVGTIYPNSVAVPISNAPCNLWIRFVPASGSAMESDIVKIRY